MRLQRQKLQVKQSAVSCALNCRLCNFQGNTHEFPVLNDAFALQEIEEAAPEMKTRLPAKNGPAKLFAGLRLEVGCMLGLLSTPTACVRGRAPVSR